MKVITLTRRDRLLRGDCNSQPPIIKVLDVDCASSKGSEQIDLGAIKEIIALSLESVVRFLLNLKLDIASEDTREMVTFATEVNLLARLHTTVNVHVQHFPLNNSLFARASLATVFLSNHLTLAVAVRTYRLEPLNHRAHLTHHRLHTTTAARRTRLYGTLFAATAFTLRADY